MFWGCRGTACRTLFLGAGQAVLAVSSAPTSYCEFGAPPPPAPAPPSPPEAPNPLQSDRIADDCLLPAVDAVKMGATPLTSLMAVAEPAVRPCVETIITTSPFRKLVTVMGGRLLTIWLNRGSPLGDAGGCDDGVALFAPAGLPGPACPPLPGAPRNSSAIFWAVAAGSWRNSESGVTFTTTGALAIRSITVISFAPALTASTAPAMFRNDPETTSAAMSSVPSALKVPRARSWSPGWI